MVVDETSKRLRADQRDVAGEHQHLTLITQPVWDRAQSIAGAVRFELLDALGATADHRDDVVATRRHHHDRGPPGHGDRRVDDVVDEGAPRQRMEHLGKGAAHPRPLSGGEDHCPRTVGHVRRVYGASSGAGRRHRRRRRARRARSVRRHSSVSASPASRHAARACQPRPAVSMCTVARPQPALDRSLAQAHALHLLQGDDHHLGPHPPGARQRVRGAVVPEGQPVIGQGRPQSRTPRRPGTRRRNRGGARKHALQQPGSVLTRAHRQQRARQLRAALLTLRAAPLASDVHLQPHPPEAPPEQRLHPAHRLDASVRDGLGPGLQQAATEAKPVSGLGEPEVVHGVEAAEHLRHHPDHGRDRHRGGGRPVRDEEAGDPREHGDADQHVDRRGEQGGEDHAALSMRSKGCAGGSGVSDARPWARASNIARTLCASPAPRYASRVRPVPRPATTTRTSASPSTRATTGEITSMAWMRDSGTRIDCRRTRPVVICRSPPWTRQRVTSHETTTRRRPPARAGPSSPRGTRCAAPPGVELGAEEHEHRHGAAGAHHRRQGVQPGPLRLRRRCEGRAGGGGAAIRARGLGLAERRQAIAQPVGLLLHETGDAGVAGRRGGVQLHGGEPEQPVDRPALTSMNCMRP